jgi:hypothetical protein
MKFVIKNKQDKQSLINYLKELENDYIVDVKKQRNNRSNMQNNYYWACIVQPLGSELGYFPDEMHDILKMKFTAEWETHTIIDDGVDYKREGFFAMKSTARMNAKEFEVYADQIRIWALTELGIRLMLPNEYN